MILAATGHRPDKLGGYTPLVDGRLLALASNYIDRLAPGPDYIISGMALGWDTAIAHASFIFEIPLICAIPFVGQEMKWPEESRRRYAQIINKAWHVHYVCEPGWAAWKMQKRNEWMVDESTHLVALWNGSPGGTANCLAYAEKCGRPIENLWPQWRERYEHS